jgi:sulfite exporter TauE/SafE
MRNNLDGKEGESMRKIFIAAVVLLALISFYYWAAVTEIRKQRKENDLIAQNIARVITNLRLENLEIKDLKIKAGEKTIETVTGTARGLDPESAKIIFTTMLMAQSKIVIIKGETVLLSFALEPKSLKLEIPK